MKRIPVQMQEKIRRFHKWQDAQRSLFGNLLLIEGIKSLKLSGYKLEQLSYTAFGRPYLGADVDFNISHSGEYTICAISQINKVGIDIEKIVEIPVADFEEQFSKQEIAAIEKDKSMRYFYNLWTQKEAFLKAIGKGLQVPLNTVSINDKMINWENKFWYLDEIRLDEHYVSHLCSDTAEPGIMVREISFD
ncbi:MAG: 4'-phosphopantetheinyl transferase superfamily protein [Chitinophagaceae bacterium]